METLTQPDGIQQEEHLSDVDPFAWITDGSAARGRGRAPSHERQRTSSLGLILAGIRARQAGDAGAGVSDFFTLTLSWGACWSLLKSALRILPRAALDALAALLAVAPGPGAGRTPSLLITQPPPAGLARLPHVALACRLLPVPAALLQTH